MGDELERFVMKNRDAFDSEIPRDDLWRGIQNQVKHTNPMEQFWRIAAILLLMSTVYLVVDRTIEKTPQTDVVSVEMQEFGNVEQYYAQLIAEKKQEIAQYDKSDLKRAFLVEIERLDQMYEELKKTYTRENAADRVVDAMINNLKLRIDILNQQINILKQLNATQNEKDEHKSI